MTLAPHRVIKLKTPSMLPRRLPTSSTTPRSPGLSTSTRRSFPARLRTSTWSRSTTTMQAGLNLAKDAILGAGSISSPSAKRTSHRVKQLIEGYHSDLAKVFLETRYKGTHIVVVSASCCSPTTRRFGSSLRSQHRMRRARPFFCNVTPEQSFGILGQKRNFSTIARRTGICQAAQRVSLTECTRRDE